MARMHSKRKGKSGSTKPLRTSPPPWVTLSPEDLEDLIVTLAKKGETPSTIGTILRDQYGIPSAELITKKRITRILEEKGIRPELPEDLLNLIRRSVSLESHFAGNKKDNVAKRGKQLLESKINRLAKYYKRKGRIPSDWKYDPSKARLFVR
jgi:small subunit ribosomal protein S15